MSRGRDFWRYRTAPPPRLHERIAWRIGDALIALTAFIKRIRA